MAYDRNSASSSSEEQAPRALNRKLAGSKRRRLFNNSSSDDDDSSTAPPPRHDNNAEANEDSSSDDDSMTVPPQRKTTKAPPQRNKMLEKVDEDSSSDDCRFVFRSQRNMTKTTRSSAIYSGWLETSNLKVIAERYKGTASQFRIVYATNEVKDSVTKTMILPNTLVVQSRFVSAAGNLGGQTYTFINWKLPGKTNRHSIYKSTRPGFHNAGTPLNAYPSIVLDNDLHPVVKTLVTTFLEEAEPGTTPFDFHGHGDGPELFFLSHNHRALPTMEIESVECNEAAACNETTKDSDQDDDAANYVHDEPHVDERPHNSDESPKELDDDAGANAFDDEEDCRSNHRAQGPDETDKEDACNVGEEASDQGNGSKKRTWFQSFFGHRSATKKQRKIYGGSKRQSPTSVSFHVNGPTTKQFFVLVEGIVETHDSALAASHDHLRDIFLDGRVESMPCRGRLVELLPNVALPGAWLATIVGADGDATRVSGLVRSSMRDLKGARIVLRHKSFLDLGMLSEKTSMHLPPGSTSRQVHVSTIDPSISRRKDFDRQGMIDEDGDPLVVGSIAIAACEQGCTSWSDKNSKLAGELASDLLVASRETLLKESNNGRCRVEDLENLLAIPARKSTNKEPVASTNVGVSFVCKLTAKESYSVMIAQDEEGRTVAVDVVLGQSDPRCSLSSNASSSTMRGPKLTAANIERLVKEVDVELSANNSSTVRNAVQNDELLSHSASPHHRSSSASVASFGHVSQSSGVEAPTDYRAAKPSAVTPAVPNTKRKLSDAATKPSAVTPAVQKTKQKLSDAATKPSAVTPAIPKTKQQLSNAAQSMFSPTETMQPKVALVTPCADRRQADTKRESTPLRQSDKRFSQAREGWSESEISDYEDNVENAIGHEARTKNEDSVEDYDDCQIDLDANMSSEKSAEVNTCLGMLSRPRSYWSSSGYILFFVSLMVFCLEVPQRLPETMVRFEGRNVFAQHSSTFHEWLRDVEVIAPPPGFSFVRDVEVVAPRPGFSIVGSEGVSLGAIVLIAAIFGGM